MASILGRMPQERAVPPAPYSPGTRVRSGVRRLQGALRPRGWGGMVPLFRATAGAFRCNGNELGR